MRSFVLLTLGVAGCVGPGKDGTDRVTYDDTDVVDSGPDSGDTAVAGALDPALVRRSDNVATVLIVEWDPVPGAERVWVEYGPDEGYGATAEARAGEDRAVLLGLHAESEVHLRVRAEVDGQALAGPDQSIRTGALPADLPSLAVERVDPGWGHAVLTSCYDLAGEGSWVVILDGEGEVVWYFHDPMIIPAARLALGGQGVVWLGNDPRADLDLSLLVTQDLDGERRVEQAVPGGHHDFWQHADGSTSWLKRVQRRVDTWEVAGDALVTTTSDGDEVEVWNAFDDIGAVPESDWASRQTSDGVDWTHANGLWHDEAANRWYVSLYYEEAVRLIDGDSGRTEQIWGGDDSDVDVDGAAFGPQHAPRLVDGRLVLFDNGGSREVSRVAGYRVEAGSLVEELSLPHPDGGHTTVQGDVNALPDGGWIAAFGDHGDAVAWDTAGATRWRLRSTSSLSFGHIAPVQDLRAP